MYRYRSYSQVLYGHFNEFIKLWDDLNALARKRGWPQATVWTPTVGTSNTGIAELEFADLASFQKYFEAFLADAEVMKVYRGGAPITVQGSWHEELVEQVTKPLA